MIFTQIDYHRFNHINQPTNMGRRRQGNLENGHRTEIRGNAIKPSKVDGMISRPQKLRITFIVYMFDKAEKW